MKKNLKLKVAGGAVAMAAVLGGGAAIAADKLSPTEESDAIVADVAKQLGLDTAKVEAAIQQALENRVDAAVAAGRLTEAQGEELKKRIASGDLPLVGVGPGLGHHLGGHLFGGLEAAADYLGLSESELRERLHDGSSLAEIAKAEGKSVDGLVDALVKSAKADLADAVAAGKLTDAQRDELEANLSDRIRSFVEHEPGAGKAHGPGGFGFRAFGGPPPTA
jgi:hypothetical protein